MDIESLRVPDSTAAKCRSPFSCDPRRSGQCLRTLPGFRCQSGDTCTGAYEIATILEVVFGATSVLFAVSGSDDRLIIPWDLIPRYCELVSSRHYRSGSPDRIVARFKENGFWRASNPRDLRLLKFASLTDPSMWCEQPRFDASAKDLGRCRSISGLTNTMTPRYGREGQSIPNAARAAVRGPLPGSPARIGRHYVPKRLDVQIRLPRMAFGQARSERGWTAPHIVTFCILGQLRIRARAILPFDWPTQTWET